MSMYGPIIEFLRDSGGEAQAKTVQLAVADKLFGGTPERDELRKSGGNKVENEIAWARNDLKDAGLIDNSRHGIWALTLKGWEYDLEELGRTKPLPVFAHRRLENGEKAPAGENIETFADQVIFALLSLSPKGFELFCKKLLHAIGMENLKITGRSGDRGIDGTGDLKVDKLFSEQVIFQCKRYSNSSVGSSEIREFHGAMLNRATRGIFFTTSTFSRDAKEEAVKDPRHKIVMVDRDMLVDLMQQMNVGVRPIMNYEIDLEFFERIKFESSI